MEVRAHCRNDCNTPQQMTENLPNYAELEPPDGKPIEEYTTHERRAAVLRRIKDAGSPFAIKQARLAEEFGVHRSTVSRDMSRIRESVAENLASDAKVTTRSLMEKTVRELQDRGEWKAAWDVIMDWNDWLADLGEQRREPRKSKVDVRSRHSEVAYQVVRETDDGPIPVGGGETADADPEDLGFTSAPTTIELEEPTDG